MTDPASDAQGSDTPPPALPPRRRGLIPGLPPHASPGPVSAQSRFSILVSLAVAFFLVAVVADGPVRDLARSLDQSLHHKLNILTRLGESEWSILIGLAVVALAWLLRRRVPPALAGDLVAVRTSGLFMVYAVAGSSALASLAKNIIGRMRPSAADDAKVLEFSVMAFRAAYASFPSGHATTATAAALVLAWSFPRHAWAFLAVGLSVALSRAFLGVHWLTDCLAGILLGAVITLLIHNAMLRRGHRLPVPQGAASRIVGETLRQARLGLRALSDRLFRRKG